MLVEVHLWSIALKCEADSVTSSALCLDPALAASEPLLELHHIDDAVAVGSIGLERYAPRGDPEDARKRGRTPRAFLRSLVSLIYALGMTPGALSGHFAMVASSILRCWATNAGGVWVSQFDREISS